MEPTARPDWVQILNGIYLILFALGAAVGAILTAARWARYKLAKEEAPELLLRDLWARLTLALPFMGILIIRLFDIDVQNEWWGVVWWVGSGALAVFGIWLYVYYEYFIVER